MEPCPPDTPLEALELNYIAETLGPFEWRKLGLYLGIPEPRLANWERQFMMNTEQAANQMLNVWHNNQMPKEERMHLVTALQNCRLRNMSDKIRTGECRRGMPAGMRPIARTNFDPQQPHAAPAQQQLPPYHPAANYGPPAPQTAPEVKEEAMETAMAARAQQAPMHEISEVLLRDLSTKLGAEWKSVGTYLGFEFSQIEQIQEQHHHLVKECIFQMLLLWRNTNGVGATKQKLKKALRKSERSDLEHFVDHPDDDDED